MRPKIYALSLYRGDSYTWIYRFWNDEEKTEPTDFTDCTAGAEVRNQRAGDVIMSMAATINANEITVVLASEDWDDWTAGTTGRHDLQVTYPGGEVVTYVAGPVEIDGDVFESEPLGGQSLSRVN